MKKGLMKSGWIATIISVVTGGINIISSFFGGSSTVAGGEGVKQTIPWLQTLLIMVGVFVFVFIILIIYYFVVKKKIEDIPSPE